jgi:hypothetical protein
MASITVAVRESSSRTRCALHGRKPPVRPLCMPHGTARAHVVRAGPGTRDGDKPLSSPRQSRRDQPRADRGRPQPSNALHREQKVVMPPRVLSLWNSSEAPLQRLRADWLASTPHIAGCCARKHSDSCARMHRAEAPQRCCCKNHARIQSGGSGLQERRAAPPSSCISPACADKRVPKTLCASNRLCVETQRVRVWLQDMGAIR